MGRAKLPRQIELRIDELAEDGCGLGRFGERLVRV